jgi:carbamoyltransferase
LQRWREPSTFKEDMVYTLGINAAFHDSSACLVHDGQIIAAAEEERFTRIKHGKRPLPFSTWELPFHAIHFCLKEAGINLSDVDHVAYAFDPYGLLGSHRTRATIELPLEPSAHPKPEEWESVWDPLFLSSIVNSPRHLSSGAPHHLAQAFKGVTPKGPYKWHFVPHHLAHAASAFHPSPYKEAAILTLDGRGERATTTYAFGHGTQIELLGQVCMPHSLGLLYEQVTSHLGFLQSSDEYKVMALASFGQPKYLDKMLSLIDFDAETGQYKIHACDFEEFFGPKRERGAKMEERHFDLAQSLQKALEETVLKMATWLHRRTGAENLCLAGGVALNCVMNARIRDESPFKNIWVQPAAGDAGTALGAALWIDGRERAVSEREAMDHAYFGPAYSEDEIESFLKWSKTPYRKLSNIAEDVAEILAQDKIIGWFQGRMEFGPRALGARSILASPIKPEMQARLNELKDREDFRPVAPAVTEEDAELWFENARPSPFMLFVNRIRPEKRTEIPAVCHTDGTARIQTVNRSQNPLYYDLLKAFAARTGVPILVNTSFNTRGEPVVCSPRDAVESFWSSPLDALVIGSYLLEKRTEPST